MKPSFVVNSGTHLSDFNWRVDVLLTQTLRDALSMRAKKV